MAISQPPIGHTKNKHHPLFSQSYASGQERRITHDISQTFGNKKRSITV
jgi:hypothetical protein